MTTHAEYHLFTGAINNSGTKKPETESSKLDSTVNDFAKPIIKPNPEPNPGCKTPPALSTKSVTDISSTKWSEGAKLCSRVLGALFTALAIIAIICIVCFAIHFAAFIFPILILMAIPLTFELDIQNKEAHPDNSQTPNPIYRNKPILPPNDLSETNTLESSENSAEEKEKDFLGDVDSKKVTHSEIPSYSQTQRARVQRSFLDIDFVVYEHQHSPHWTKEEHWRERAYDDIFNKPFRAQFI